MMIIEQTNEENKRLAQNQNRFSKEYIHRQKTSLSQVNLIGQFGIKRASQKGFIDIGKINLVELVQYIKININEFTMQQLGQSIRGIALIYVHTHDSFEKDLKGLLSTLNGTELWQQYVKNSDRQRAAPANQRPKISNLRQHSNNAARGNNNQAAAADKLQPLELMDMGQLLNLTRERLDFLQSQTPSMHSREVSEHGGNRNDLLQMREEANDFHMAHPEGDFENYLYNSYQKSTGQKNNISGAKSAAMMQFDTNSNDVLQFFFPSEINTQQELQLEDPNQPEEGKIDEGQPVTKKQQESRDKAMKKWLLESDKQVEMGADDDQSGETIQEQQQRAQSGFRKLQASVSQSKNELLEGMLIDMFSGAITNQIPNNDFVNRVTDTSLDRQINEVPEPLSVTKLSPDVFTQFGQASSSFQENNGAQPEALNFDDGYMNFDQNQYDGNMGVSSFDEVNRPSNSYLDNPDLQILSTELLYHSKPNLTDEQNLHLAYLEDKLKDRSGKFLETIPGNVNREQATKALMNLMAFGQSGDCFIKQKRSQDPFSQKFEDIEVMPARQNLPK